MNASLILLANSRLRTWFWEAAKREDEQLIEEAIDIGEVKDGGLIFEAAIELEVEAAAEVIDAAEAILETALVEVMRCRAILTETLLLLRLSL